MKIRDEAGERIKRLRKKCLDDEVRVSIERARYFTKKWRETENRGISPGIRVALAMKNVYEKMTHYIDPDDRIAGKWTEYFLGTPVDIERGLFNGVLETELDKGSMLGFQLKSNARFLSYMVKRCGLVGSYRNIKNTSAVEPPCRRSA